ncbi:MAG: BamA/TamA family outer membrane protein [Okeania sp. SIO3C4]|nr:BamA/TamA family outer membrane protein [Okeania sp. SIO3C4]
MKHNLLYKALFICSFLLFHSSMQAQLAKWTVEKFNKVFNDNTSSAKPKFIAYPVIAFTPETSWEFGASGLLVYYAKRDTANRLSELSAFTYATLKNQYGLWLDHAFYTDDNDHFFLGRIRIQQFPLLYYGIGVDTPNEPIAQVDGFTVSIRERLLRKVAWSFYIGLELDYSQLSGVSFNERTEETFTHPAGDNGSINFGTGIGLVFDERHNVLNPRKGLFVEGGFLHYDEVWGSDYSFTNYFLDFRCYYPTTKQQVLAYQFYANVILEGPGGEVPFNQLTLMGGESLMRGYYLGRYRDNILLATQAEYRFLPFPFSKRFGGTVFGSVGGVSPRIADIDVREWVGAGGLGVRFLLFPAKDIYTRIDVAFTPEGLGYYFYIGEAF